MSEYLGREFHRQPALRVANDASANYPGTKIPKDPRSPEIIAAEANSRKKVTPEEKGLTKWVPEKKGKDGTVASRAKAKEEEFKKQREKAKLSNYADVKESLQNSGSLSKDADLITEDEWSPEAREAAAKNRRSGKKEETEHQTVKTRSGKIVPYAEYAKMSREEHEKLNQPAEKK